MADHLNGSFSGLWICDLCGQTGSACHCEHFNRGTGVHGPDKTLTGAEIAAEHWRSVLAWYRTGLEDHKEQANFLGSLGRGDDYASEG